MTSIVAGAAAVPAYATDLTFEGESMTLAPGASAADTADASAAAPAHRTLALFDNGVASKSVTVPQSTTHLLVRVRGDACAGAPAVSVKVDGVQRYAGPVSTTGYRGVGFRLSVAAGTHTVAVNMTNDHAVAGVCDRTVYVDHVRVVGQPFSTTGWRNTPLPANAPLATNSSAMVADIARQRMFPPNRSDGSPGPDVWVTTTEGYSDPIYVVSTDQPVVAEVDKRSGPDNMGDQWQNVPLPPDALPAPGEGSLVLWQPETERVWEFMGLRKEPDGTWSATNGGRIDNVQSNEGMFGDPPGTKYGGSATAISLLAGMPRIEELKRGVIDHAIDFAVANDQGYDGWCWPAHRTDTLKHWRTDPAAIPAGTRFRLRADFDITAWHSSNPMSRYALMLARAIQKYGMVARDEGLGFGFWAEDPTPTGEDPYHGPGGLFEGKAPNGGGVFKNFPWHELQALAQPPGTEFGCVRDPDVVLARGDT